MLTKTWGSRPRLRPRTWVSRPRPRTKELQSQGFKTMVKDLSFKAKAKDLRIGPQGQARTKAKDT